MAENKTKATEASVESFLNSLGDERRADAKALVKMMQSVAGEKPKMWGPSIVGFGSYHYRYESGREGDMPLICFSPRRSSTVVYGMGSADKALLEKLGKHTLSGGCLHIKKLSAVDAKVLEKLISVSFAKMRKERGT
jgi:hypothetical protein